MGQSPPGLAGVSGTALSPLLLAELPKPISLPRITQLFPLPLGFGKVRTRVRKLFGLGPELCQSPGENSEFRNEVETSSHLFIHFKFKFKFVAQKNKLSLAQIGSNKLSFEY